MQWCLPITGFGFRSSNCALAAACRATAPRRATSSRRHDGSGFLRKDFAKSPTTLNELPMPSIIHWKFNHFVVLERINDKFAYINDPAVGRRRVDLNEFDESFTGVVLAMEPGPDFRPQGHKPTVLPVLAQALAHSKSAVVLLLALSVALSGTWNHYSGVLQNIRR